MGSGSTSFHLVAHDAFEGSVSVKGAQISNLVASMSAAFAWALLALSTITKRRHVVLFAAAALIIPGIHSLIFIDSYYTPEVRNSLNHIGFLLSVACLAMVCFTDLWSLTNHEEEVPLDR